MPKNFYCEFYCQKNSSLENGLKWSKKARKIKIAVDFCLLSFNCWCIYFSPFLFIYQDYGESSNYLKHFLRKPLSDRTLFFRNYGANFTYLYFYFYIFMFFFEVFLVLVIFWKSCVFSRKKQFSNQKTPEKNTLFLNILQTSSEVVCFAN